MTDLADFAALLAEAKAKQRIEAENNLKKQQKLQEKKVAEAAPFLSELFTTVVESKKISDKIRHEERKKAEPVLQKLQDALQNPDKFKKTNTDTKRKVVEVVKELEQKAEQLEEKLKQSLSKSDIDKFEKNNKLSELETKFLTLFKKLQQDFENLKKYALATPKQSPYDYGWGGAGSGEVNLKNLDDVDTSNMQNGYFIRYNENKNKFDFVPGATGTGSSIVTSEIELSGKTFFVSNLAHGLSDIVSYKVIKNVTFDVIEAVIKINNNLDINVDSNIDLSGHILILKGIL